MHYGKIWKRNWLKIKKSNFKNMHYSWLLKTFGDISFFTIEKEGTDLFQGKENEYK